MSDSNVTIRVSAPGKVILHGEHSVVYGKLALAASLGLRTKLEFCEVDDKIDGQDVIRLEFGALGLMHIYSMQDISDLLSRPIPLSKAPSNYNFTLPDLINREEALHVISTFIKEKSGFDPLNSKQEQALTAFFYLFWAILGSVDFELKQFKLKIDSDLTISAGTGSSASFAVTLAAFMLHFIRVKKCKSKNTYKSFKWGAKLDQFDKTELDLISKWAFQSEKIIHGTPSGVDNTICTYGSMVEFHKGSNPKLIQMTTKFNLILINTNVPRDTKTLVAKVATMRDKHKMIVDGVLELIDETTVKALQCIRQINGRMGDEFSDMDSYVTLGELTEINQNLLRCLNVSHPKLDEACQILSEKGLKGKLTGAGGGGFAICLVPPYVKKIAVEKAIDELNAKGFVAVLTDLGGKGVSID